MNHSAKLFLIFAVALAFVAVIVVGLGGALTPLLIAFGLAYLTFPLIQALERKGLPRTEAVIGVFAIIVLAVAVALTLVIPGLIADGRDFIKELPQNSAVAIEKVERLSQRIGYPLDLSRDSIKEVLTEHASNVSADILKSSSVMVKRVFSNFLGGVLFVLNLFLIPLFFFHLIHRYEQIAAEARSLVPIPLRPKLKHYAQLSNTVLSGYVRGQFLVAMILAGLYGTSFAAIGLRFGFVIGIATGLLSIIPFVGSLFGFLAAMTVALANFDGPGTLVAVVVAFAVIQALEGMVITPKLVGDKVGLSVLSTMLALIIGGNLLGLPGMILAIPSAAIFKALLKDLKKEYQRLPFYIG